MSGITYDVATALWQGARPNQEDTLLADFHGGMDRGFAVLADGMGGHAAGDLASRLVVIDAASHLKFLMHDGEALEKSLASELTSAIETANELLKDRAATDRRLQGMGTTFLATVLFEDRLYWASVGDSPLYLWREGELRQLNEDHSMAPVIDQMAKAGEITAADAANHPDRNALTSVLMGSALKAVDVPETATVLDPGDVLIQASDGVQFLDEAQISGVLAGGGSSREIADGLMSALRALNDPTQDNTAVLVLQLSQTHASVTPMERLSDSTEPPVGSTLAPDAATLRAPTPVTVSRPVGARRWVVPAGLLGGAAVAAALVFGLPALQSGPESPTTFETAALVPEALPAPVAAAPTRALVLAPVDDPAPSADDGPETVEELVVSAGLIDAAAPPATVPDKLATPAASAIPASASGATIQFGTVGNEASSGQAPGAIGIGELIPTRERISAPDATQDPEQPVPAPQSQRTLRSDGGGLRDGG